MGQEERLDAAVDDKSFKKRQSETGVLRAATLHCRWQLEMISEQYNVLRSLE